MCNQPESQSSKSIWEEAIAAVTKLKTEVDHNCKVMVESGSEPEIMLQLQGCCTEFLQCTEALSKGIQTWSDVPITQASV